MTGPITLIVDGRGWQTPLDPEFVSAMVSVKFMSGIDLKARALDDQWAQQLPKDDSTVFLILTRVLPPGWQEPLKAWAAPNKPFYILYTNDADLADLRILTPLATVPPYRIAQPNNIGLEHAAHWIKKIVNPPVEGAQPIVKTARTRWRNLSSNVKDPYYYPEEYTTSMEGVAGYRLTAASHRGKTHAHQGTFREDAFAIATTTHWNIMAVADGAGTAPMARVGSNLAVSKAVAAMKEAMPESPATEDVGRAIWAGLRAAYQAIKSFGQDHNMPVSDLSSTLQLLIHWPQAQGCLLGVAHIGDGIVTAETPDGQFYLLTDPDTDPDDSSRTLFLTSGPLKQWMERAKVYQFDEPLDIVALMTDGLSGDLEPYVDLLHSNLFEVLRHRVLCYPLPQREQALLGMISYDRRGSFDDRTLAVLSRN